MIKYFKNFINEDIKTNFSLSRIRGLYRQRIFNEINDEELDKLWELIRFVNWNKRIKQKFN